MTRASIESEVCVIGAGPSGAALASRLAGLGHDVAVVERHPFPRSHVGESVSPGVWPLLELLGVRDRVEAAGFPRALRARVRWGGLEERHVTAGGAEPGLTVDRGRFDRLVLDGARAAGATVLQPATVRSAFRSRDGWEVTLATLEGIRNLRARFVADASGRRRVLGGRRRPTSPRTLALHGVWRGVESEDGTQTRVDVSPEAWMWGAHLPGGTFRAMVFVDPGLVRASRRDGQSVERVYRDVLLGSPLFADLPRGPARLEGAVSACDATCFADEAPIDDRSVKVGEAGYAIDPLSSSGVQTAIQSAVAASAAVHSILSADGDRDAAIDYYSEHQRHAVEHHASLAARAYAEASPYAAQPFWRRRASARPDPPAAPEPADLGRLLPQRVRLTRDAALVEAPCVVGDRVERRPALFHPALERPVAYLGDTELAPLLLPIGDDRPLSEVVHEWTRSIPPAKAHAIAGWLAERGLLEPAGAPVRP